MKAVFWFYVALVAAGLVVLCWPEANSTMLIRLSEMHGPSAADLAGLIVLAAGYLPMIFTVAKRFKDIQRQTGNITPIVLTSVSCMTLALIAVSLRLPNDYLLWASVTVSTCCQSFLVFYAFKKSSPAS